MKKIVKRILVFLGVNGCLYLIAVVVLINWPIPQKVHVKNYDYTSIDTVAVKTYAHHEEWQIVNSYQNHCIQFNDNKFTSKKVNPREKKMFSSIEMNAFKLAV